MTTLEQLREWVRLCPDDEESSENLRDYIRRSVAPDRDWRILQTLGQALVDMQEGKQPITTTISTVSRTPNGHTLMFDGSTVCGQLGILPGGMLEHFGHETLLAVTFAEYRTPVVEEGPPAQGT